MTKQYIFMTKLITLILFIPLISSCQKSIVPISYGSDACDNCRMTISDPKYGSELISDKGKIYKFDSIECLAAYADIQKTENIHSLWVTDFGSPDNFINTKDALFFVSPNLRSPMGLNISAFSSQNKLEEVKSQYGGEVYNWESVTTYVKNEWK